MAETIMCPYTKEGASSHSFKHKIQIKEGFIIHYCGGCKNVISIEMESEVFNINQADRLHLRGDI
jgi:hypothetical protein